jgi:SAM-dependent methyltransferase
MSAYHDGLNAKLLDAIPPDARHVLELGCASGRLGEAFSRRHPGVRWTGIERDRDAAARAAAVLDAVHVRDIDRDGLVGIGEGFDTIVVGDLLEHLVQPEAALAALHDLSAPGARLVCCLPNGVHASVVERMLAGDFSYDPMGLLDRTHVRLYSPSSAFKLFLDGGWLPDLHDAYRVEPPAGPFVDALLRASESLGVPPASARHRLGLYQMIVVCSKWTITELSGAGPMAPFTVIVPVNRPGQFELNVARSPGLAEAGVQLVPVQGATSAAHAWREGVARAAHPWRVMLHQDVYCPVGSGFALSRRLGALQAAGVTMLPVGFAGLEAAGRGAVRYAGMVIDRTRLFAHPGSNAGASIDEFAVAMHADAVVEPDPSLGWHLWATDLCLQARALAGRDVAQILEVPLFHNSTTDHVLPAAFHESAARLLEKHPAHASIPTLCGELRRPGPGPGTVPAAAAFAGVA